MTMTTRIKGKNRVWQRLLVVSVLSFLFFFQSYSQTASDWRDTLNVLSRQIAAEPWSTDLHLRKAAANLELQQWQYAADEYSVVLEKEPHNPAALFYRGYANTHLRRYDLARNDYEELVKYLPRHFEGRLALSYVLQRMGRRQDAMDHLNQLVELHADSATAYASRASLEYEMELWEPALYDWQQASRLAPLNADYVVSCVDLLLRQNRTAEARRMLDAAAGRGIPKGLLYSWYEKCRKRKR